MLSLGKGEKKCGVYELFFFSGKRQMRLNLRDSSSHEHQSCLKIRPIHEPPAASISINQPLGSAACGLLQGYPGR